MGGPRKNPTLAALQSRSRFCEGSMNDRASAAPPVHFLGPEALAALEQPVIPPASGHSDQHPPRPSHDTGSSSSSSGGGGGFSQTWSRKTGSRLFGQVWEGMRGRLRLRRDDSDAKKTTTATTPAAAISAATTTTAVTQTNAEPITIYTDPTERDGPPASRTRSRLAVDATLAATPMDIPRPASSAATTAADFQFTGFASARPSRDEVLASYQQLMAGGFFHAHAIQSSRHGLGRPTPAPGTRPATSHGPNHNHQRSQQPPPPQWPLATPLPEPVQSPTSVSSRGTKRAAAPDSDSDDESMPDADADDDEHHAGVFDKENQAPAHPNTVHNDNGSKQPKKRLRRLASRESLFVPKTRAATSSSDRRSLSSSIPPPPANKLQKRRPQQQSRPRHVSDGGGSARVLRGRAAQEHRSMRVVPDEGRGIPSVPTIPVRFTYGEDREGNGPWRGLRVR